MKKINNLVKIFLLLVLVSINGCQKDFEEIQSQAEINKDVKIISYTTGRGIQKNILEIKDKETAMAIVMELSQAIVNNEKNFVTKYSSLSPEELDVKEIEVNFNPNQPLLDFEKELGFESKLDEYLLYEDNWLKNDVLDEKISPERMYNWLEEEELVLYNKDFALKIGTSFFKEVSDGTIEIINDDINTFRLLENIESLNDLNLEKYNNLKIYYRDDVDVKTTTGCTISNRESRDWIYKRKRKMRSTSYFGGSTKWGFYKFKVETKSLKKRLIGWGRTRVGTISAAYQGDFGEYGEPCGSVIGSMSYAHDIDVQHNASKAKYINWVYQGYKDPKPYVEKNTLQTQHIINSYTKYYWAY